MIEIVDSDSKIISSLLSADAVNAAASKFTVVVPVST